jgi:hypothetical protein
MLLISGEGKLETCKGPVGTGMTANQKPSK